MTAVNREKGDRLPATTHHVMPYFLNRYMNGVSIPEFFEQTGLDFILRTIPQKPDEAAGASGGYILAPSDHFFDADPVPVTAFAEEAAACVY
ncbi:MAG: hypothetical protein JW951_05385 [Lentisphaerae bacterium]|nr:hypothetical protein [Lentisphaerota bacterium]